MASTSASQITLPTLPSTEPVPPAEAISTPGLRHHSTSSSETLSPGPNGELEKPRITKGDLERDTRETDLNEDGDLEKGASEDEKEKEEVKIYSEDGHEVIIVDWKGPDDPAYPKNWNNGHRMIATAVMASYTFLSPVSSSMIAPAVNQLSVKLNIVPDVEKSMIVSLFLLAYAFGPLILGPLSELYGRRIILQLGNLLYLIFNLACAFATTKEQMFAFRFLAGLGGSAPMNIGAGLISDLWRPEERGKATVIYSVGPLLGPALGPVCGGWIAEKVAGDGYKWVFYSTTIVCVLIQIVGWFYLSETYAPELLRRQALEIKKSMGLDRKSDRVQTVYEIKAGRVSAWHVISHGMVRPFVMFYHEKMIQVLGLFMAFIYGTIYITIVSTTDIFLVIYGESVGVAGTNFIALGLGCIMWAQLQGRLTDKLFAYLKERNNGKAMPEFRLPFMIPASFILPTGLLLYGWCAQHHLSWVGVDVGLWLIGAGMIGSFGAINMYIIDAYGLHAASGLAAATFFRSLCAFAFPLFAPYLYKALGYGWGCSLLALVAAVVGIPSGPILYRYGEYIRGKSSYAKK